MNSNRHQPTSRVIERTEVVVYDQGEDDDAELVKVGDKLWHKLELGAEEHKAIALTPIKQINGSTKSLICWAKLDSEVSIVGKQL
jgi:hypothetical protein